MKNLISFLILACLLSGCKSKKSGKDLVEAYLIEKNFVADHTIDEKLKELLPEVNCVVKSFTTKHFVTAEDFDKADTNQILLISFRKKNGIGTASGFSDLGHHIVFICPPQIKEFVHANSLSDTADIAGYLGIILLHEAGHFIAGIPGNFDEVANANQSKTKLGEQDMGTDPVYITVNKRLELKVDSLAIEMVKKGIKLSDKGCFNCSMNIQLAVNGAEFMIFGKRIVSNFGSPAPNQLKDQSWTHPNLELRLAFMNYYLNPNYEKRKQIDDYLYEREIAPINRQMTDPRIYQGNEKKL